MRCSEAHEALSALIDGECAGEGLTATAAHIAECPSCTERARDYQRIGEQLRTAARAPMPPDLADRVRARLARENRAETGRAPFAWHAFVRQAAVLLLTAGLTGLMTWHLAGARIENRMVERDIVAAHARALLQDSTVQIASSQSHTVKPWFNGRVEFAPTVKDLTAEGFPLIGGRLDFIGDQRVAAVVYKRRLHVIDVFVWPAAAGETAVPPRLSTINGYNTVSWTAGGLTYWAISDLNAKELAQFQTLL